MAVPQNTSVTVKNIFFFFFRLDQALEHEFTKVQLRMERVFEIFDMLEMKSHALLDRILAKQRKSLQLITQVHDEQQLPKGYKEVYDEEEDKVYYIEEKTGKSVWTIPQSQLDKRPRTVLNTSAAQRWKRSATKLKMIMAFKSKDENGNVLTLAQKLKNMGAMNKAKEDAASKEKEGDDGKDKTGTGNIDIFGGK